MGCYMHTSIIKLYAKVCTIYKIKYNLFNLNYCMVLYVYLLLP